jgi:hypothetical protein
MAATYPLRMLVLIEDGHNMSPPKFWYSMKMAATCPLKILVFNEDGDSNFN